MQRKNTIFSSVLETMAVTETETVLAVEVGDMA